MDKLLISKRLRALRGSKTVAEVTEALGITASALLNYEQGIRIPRDDIKRFLARYYSTTVDDIFFN